MRDTVVWKVGSILAILRLTALWYVVNIANHSSGHEQAIGYFLQILLMLPELLIARYARNNESLWATEMTILISVFSYLFVWIIWRLVRLASQSNNPN
jgi:hypothetical protein